ncbi:MAG: hypothetical protein ACRDOK_18695 [Streptosporangiaceae bacterium]
MAATRRGGRSENRTQAVPVTPVITGAARNTASSAIATWRGVCVTESSGSPVTTIRSSV